MLSVVAEVLAHRATRVGGDELEWRRLRGGGGHDDGVFHRAFLGQTVHHLCDGGTFLAYGDVDAGDVAALLIQDRINRDSRLAGLAIANNQLTLAATNRDQRINRLQSGLHGLGHRLSFDDARGLDLNTTILARDNFALAIDGLSESIHDAATQFGTDRNFRDAAGALDFVTLPDLVRLSKQSGTDVIFVKVQNHAVDIVREFEQLTNSCSFESVNTSNTIAGRKNGSGFPHFEGLSVFLKLLAEDVADFCGANRHLVILLNLS